MGKNKKKQEKRKSPKFIKKDQSWLKHFRFFNELLKTKNLYLKDIESDGNCLFRAISDQFQGHQNEHIRYRKQAGRYDYLVEYIAQNKDYYQPFIGDEKEFEEYIDQISKEGEWGGNLELQALSQLLEVTIVIHTVDTSPLVIQNTKTEKQINLAYHNQDPFPEHYSSVRMLGQSDNEPTDFQFIKIKMQKMDLNKEAEDWGTIKNPKRICECGSNKKYKDCCNIKDKEKQLCIKI